MPWAVFLSLLILGLAKLIEHFFAEIIENKQIFLGVVAIFLVIYAFGAYGVSQLNPYAPTTTVSDVAFIELPPLETVQLWFSQFEDLPLLRFPLALLR